MHSRTNLARWSVIAVSVITAITACSDDPTAISAPQPGLEARTSLSTLDGVPSGTTVVVFTSETSIPAAGLDLISSLGGIVTQRWDNVGVAFVRGLPLSALANLRANVWFSWFAHDRYINWLPKTTIRGVFAGDAAAIPQNNPANATYFANGTQWNMKQIEAMVWDW